MIRKWATGLGFLVFLAFITFSILKKESIKAHENIVLFELEPIDPRSLFQGDYMELRYAINEAVMNSEENLPKSSSGILNFRIIEKVASPPFWSNSSSAKPNLESEALVGCIRFYRHSSQIRFGAEQYFFQEGEAKTFENAKFAGLAISKDCESVLVGLYDENKTLLLSK